MSIAEVLKVIREFAMTHGDASVSSRWGDITPSSDLFGDGYVSSLTFLSLILFLEEKLQVHIELWKHDKDSFRTIDNICSALSRERHISESVNDTAENSTRNASS